MTFQSYFEMFEPDFFENLDLENEKIVTLTLRKLRNFNYICDALRSITFDGLKKANEDRCALGESETDDDLNLDNLSATDKELLLYPTKIVENTVVNMFTKFNLKKAVSFEIDYLNMDYVGLKINYMKMLLLTYLVLNQINRLEDSEKKHKEKHVE